MLGHNGISVSSALAGGNEGDEAFGAHRGGREDHLVVAELKCRVLSEVVVEEHVAAPVVLIAIGGVNVFTAGGGARA